MVRRLRLLDSGRPDTLLSTSQQNLKMDATESNKFFWILSKNDLLDVCNKHLKDFRQSTIH